MVIVQQLVNGITLGMVYALIAVGYSLVFGILRLLNMAHGAVYAFGVHMVVLFLGIHFGLWPAVLLSIAAAGILSMLIDSVVLRPLRAKKSAGITHLISVIGVSYIIQKGMLVYFGSQRRSFPRLIELGNVDEYIASLVNHFVHIAPREALVEVAFDFACALREGHSLGGVRSRERRA